MFVFDMYVNEITSPITNFCLIPSLFKLQELRQQAHEYRRKIRKLTDMLKVAEAKAVDVIVKKGAKSKNNQRFQPRHQKFQKIPQLRRRQIKKINSQNNRS